MASTPHRFDYTFNDDGDFVILIKLEEDGWKEYARWMVPGSQIDHLAK